MKSKIVSTLLGASLLAISVHASAMDLPDTITETVAFDCRGVVTHVIRDNSQQTVIGSVQVNMDLPNGKTILGNGIITGTDLGITAQVREVEANITRCFGEGRLNATLQSTISGVGLYNFELQPTRLHLKSAKGIITGAGPGGGPHFKGLVPTIGAGSG